MDINTTSEVVFAKLHLDKNLPIIIGSVYRPPSIKETYIVHLCDTIQNLYNNNRNAIFWIGWDMNLPDINWTDVSIKGNHVSSAINLIFLDTLQNCGLEQINKTS